MIELICLTVLLIVLLVLYYKRRVNVELDDNELSTQIS